MAARSKSKAGTGFEIPSDLSGALARDKVANMMFNNLPEANQRAYVAWILESRFAEMRVMRVVSTLERVSAGLALP